ncbi:MAG: hypothetical protein RR585_00845 [Coprobacillus sp.]
MKKIIGVFLIIGMLGFSVHAKSQEPKYKIIANSNQEVDIKEMYKIKKDLLECYKDWVKGVDDKDQVLADHQSDFDATYKQGEYKIVLGKGRGKSLSGEMKVNYCETTKDIETKSFLFDWLF